MFRSRWASATAGEQALLLALAQTMDDDETSSSRDYTAAIGRTTQQLSSVRQSLIDKGLIEASDFGRIRFTTPGFGEYVLLRAGPDVG